MSDNGSEPAPAAVSEAVVDSSYDMYPERRGSKFETSWLRRMVPLSGTDLKERLRCELNVQKAFEKSLGVRLMADALRSSGCPFDLTRHVCCETCGPMVTGGYDVVNNQVVVCQNRVADVGTTQAILVHEMIHMFDYCNNELDFTNVDHLACTEVRAANLTHCSFLSSMTMTQSSWFNVKATHAACVREKAICSVVAARGVSKREAADAVDRVFERCYNDLEPVGRRVRRGSCDIHRAFLERHKYGYV